MTPTTLPGWLRDLLPREYNRLMRIEPPIQIGKVAIQLVEFAYSKLCEKAGEGFDGDAHLDWLKAKRAEGYEPSPQANARWVFKQQAAVIATLKAENADLKDKLQSAYDEMAVHDCTQEDHE